MGIPEKYITGSKRLKKKTCNGFDILDGTAVVLR